MNSTHTVGSLAVNPRTVAPSDTLGRAAEAVRASNLGAVPVLDSGRLLGLVTSEILVDAVASQDHGEWPERVADLPLAPVIALGEQISASDGLLLLRANGLERAVVVDANSGLVGMVSEAELVSAVCRRVRPPLIGGMATPFGVYLTAGGVRGGVGDLALISTGIFLAVLSVVMAMLTSQFHPGGWVYARVPQLGLWMYGPQWSSGLVNWLFREPLMLAMFCLAFRSSWVAGFHAAEHQVVHAIEAADDLTPEAVARKPRVHPRCGTNLVVAVGIMSLFWNLGRHPQLFSGSPFGWLIPQLDSLNPLLAMVITYSFWRSVGAWMQQHVTTRPASHGQIRSGIRAGEQLMERYQDRRAEEYSNWRRVWNMGVCQVMIGYILVFAACTLLNRYFPGLSLPTLT